MLFELFKQHLIKSDKELEKRIKDYKEGKILDSENKEYATKLLQDYMEDFREKYKEAKKNIGKFLIKS
jgi:tryptophanyl-tRNA synthetase